MTRLAARLACVLLLSGCSLFDDGYTSVRGRVVDADTRQPVAADIEILRSTIAGSYPLARAVAGPDGRFAFDFPETRLLTTTYLDILPAETAVFPSASPAPTPLYDPVVVDQVEGGDLGEVEVHAQSLLVVRASRALRPGESLAVSVTATRTYVGTETEQNVSLDRDGVFTERVQAGARVVVQWSLYPPGPPPPGGARTEFVAERGRETVVGLDLGAP